MPVDIIMPKLDKIMDRGTIAQWLKEDGHSVNEGEPIALIETEKVAVELTSPASGTLACRCAQGSSAEVGEILGIVYLPGETPQAITPSKSAPGNLTGAMVSPSVSPMATTVDREEGSAIRATPSAKRLARELGISLEAIKKTLPGGAVISREDVLAYKSVSPSTAMPEELIPLVGWRKTMAEKMSQSRRTAADVTTVAEVDMTDLVALKKELEPKFQKESGVKISFTPFIIRAVVIALQEFPIINSTLNDDSIVLKRNCNIGLAVAREDKGLIVPVIHNAEKMDLVEISKKADEVSEKAKNDSLTLDDLRDGTFTITNVGMFGAILNTPIINTPQSAILGVGLIKKKPEIMDDQIKVRSMMYLSLSYDHRVIDGLPAVRFLQRIRGLLENPRNLLPSA